ncbi:MAG: hypothetical protein M3421_07215 [Bacteroidota bacterium]|nr:hypothetical protein [Bacteroidota bacterium]
MEVQPEKDPEMEHHLTPLAEKTNELVKQGFSEQFVMVEEGLKASESGKIFSPEELKILKHYRFEGTSDPGDMSILYLVETSDGKKGTIVDGFGTYSDNELGEFMKKVEEKENQNNP